MALYYFIKQANILQNIFPKFVFILLAFRQVDFSMYNPGRSTAETSQQRLEIFDCGKKLNNSRSRKANLTPGFSSGFCNCRIIFHFEL